MAFVQLREVNDGTFFLNTDQIVFLAETAADKQTMVRYGPRHDDVLVVEGELEEIVAQIRNAIRIAIH